jgi:CRISPR-associated protein Csm4
LGVPSLSTKTKLYEEGAVPKVKIHQPNREDNLYFHGNLFLPASTRPSVHFYALAEHGPEATNWQAVFDLMQIMADEGIGGERSVGCGRLLGVQDLGDFGLAPNEASDRSATASLVSPADEADLQQLLAWKTVTRGGRFISANKSTKRLKMVAEGALASPGLTGRHHEILTEGHAFLRFGHALHIPLPKTYAAHGNF